MTTIRIWTECYRPFLMGGDVNRPIATTVEATDPVSLGKGHQGFIVVSPKGNTYIIEKESGGIIGDNLEEVKRDIKLGDKDVMNRQVQKAKTRGLTAENMSADEFWKLMPQER